MEYETKKYGTARTVDCVTVYNTEQDEVVVFAVNKDLNEDINLCIQLCRFDDYTAAEQTVMVCDDLHAVNTEVDPNRVKPELRNNAFVRDGCLYAALEKTSWNMIRVKRNA